jgi:hypothetical protein
VLLLGYLASAVLLLCYLPLAVLLVLLLASSAVLSVLRLASGLLLGPALVLFASLMLRASSMLLLGSSALVLRTKPSGSMLVRLLGSCCFGAAPHKTFGRFFFGKFFYCVISLSPNLCLSLYLLNFYLLHLLIAALLHPLFHLSLDSFISPSFLLRLSHFSFISPSFLLGLFHFSFDSLMLLLHYNGCTRYYQQNKK